MTWDTLPTLVSAVLVVAGVWLIAQVRTLRRQNARIRAHAWGHWEALVAQHAANDAGACGWLVVANAGQFSVDPDFAVTGVRYQICDGGVVVRSGWASDVGLVEAEVGRMRGEGQ